MTEECPACNYEPPETKQVVGDPKGLHATYFTAPLRSSIVPIEQVIAYLKTGDRGNYCKDHIEEATKTKLSHAIIEFVKTNFSERKVIFGVYERKGSYKIDGSDLEPVVEKEMTFEEAASLVDKFSKE